MVARALRWYIGRMTDSTDRRRLRFEHRRGEILEAATSHVLSHGVGSLSLRRLAEAVGVSHATLLHHFSRREVLVAEIVDAAIAGALNQPDLAEKRGREPLRELWERSRSPQGAAYVKLFIELTGIAAYGDAVVRDAVSRSMRERVRTMADGLRRDGCPPEEAEAMAGWLLGAMRGLMAQLLVTGDEQSADAAFEDLHRMVLLRASAWRADGDA